MSKERIKVREFVDQFKLAMVGHDPATWVTKMFPNWPTPENDSEKIVQVEYLDEVSDEDLMDTGGEWRFREKISPEEAERVLAEMARNPRGSFGVDEIDDDEGWI
jgi:hypothetical protein